MSSVPHHKPVFFSDAELAPLVDAARKIVEARSHIQLSEKQFSMISSRLIRRMYELRLDSPEDYLKYIKKHEVTESTVLVSLLTTHHTHFFREFEQFEFLLDGRLSSMVSKIRQTGRKSLRAASFACSRGQEVYTIAMFLRYHLPAIAPDFTFDVLGLDVDPDSVAIAKNGVYHWDEVKSIPTSYAAKNWQRGQGSISDFVRASNDLKSHCKFRVGNLLADPKLSGVGGEHDAYDLVFCRNVFLYFTDKQIADTTNKILTTLAPWGIFFIGVSESLSGRKLPIHSIGHSIYVPARAGAQLTSVSAVTADKSAPVLPISVQVVEADVRTSPAAPLRVLCVDDSPTIINLLRSMLSEKYGFMVVDTASNGLEAAEKLRKNEIDVMVLDIHMPLQNGIEYLQANFGPKHPPVVILSSVQREDSSMGLRALELGASDYVEKPTISDLQVRGEELRAKLKSLVTSRVSVKGLMPTSDDLTKQFAQMSTIKMPETKLRIICCSINDRAKLVEMFHTHERNQPPTIILFDGTEGAAGLMMNQLSQDTKLSMLPLPNINTSLSTDGIYYSNFESGIELANSWTLKRRTGVFVFGGLSQSAFKSAISFSESRIFFEDGDFGLEHRKRSTNTKISRCIPSTSFLYESGLFLKKD